MEINKDTGDRGRTACDMPEEIKHIPNELGEGKRESVKAQAAAGGRARS